MKTTIVYWDYIGILQKKMETIIVCWCYFGIMRHKMETTIIVYWSYIGIMEKNVPRLRSRRLTPTRVARRVANRWKAT